ncbi:hypothetical protein AB0L71_20815 [Streptomyces sp. NPDC052052]|uniref:hypothetical protein n=1 Tax=Streptomyces sp. NPDC052052 TaxID=3154756 RepID=UPI00342E92BC
MGILSGYWQTRMLLTATESHEFRMSYTAWNSRGRYAGADATTVSNLIYTAGQGWKNLGTAMDSRTSAEVPLPGQP